MSARVRSLHMQQRHKARNSPLIADVLLAERLEHELLLALDAHEEHGHENQQYDKHSSESGDERSAEQHAKYAGVDRVSRKAIRATGVSGRPSCG